MSRKRNKAGSGRATLSEPANVVKVAQEIADLNNRESEIVAILSDLGLKEAKLNEEFRKIQLKRAELRRQFDAASAPG